jgi:hypothetical protein
MPHLHHPILMINYDRLDLVQLISVKTTTVLQATGIQPELGHPIISVDMNVNRLVTPSPA